MDTVTVALPPSSISSGTAVTANTAASSSETVTVAAAGSPTV